MKENSAVVQIDTELPSDAVDQQATWRAVEVLLRQNAALEREVERLVHELDQHTMGVQKKGYLYKWREREIYFGAKWGLRYFVLQGNKLSYYGDEHERRPRRTIDLSRCFVRDEGAKKGGQYHVFSIYLEGSAHDTTDSSLLIRLSAESSAEAAMWVDKLEQSCTMAKEDEDEKVVTVELKEGGLQKQPSLLHYITEDSTTHGSKVDLAASPTGNGTPSLGTAVDHADGETWDAAPLDLDSRDLDAKHLPPAMLERVKSASLVLQKSMSRIGSNLLFNMSGTRLSRMADVKPRHKEQRVIRSFPAYKPMHIHSVPSPLSNEARPGEYNFRGFFNLGAIILVVTHCDLIVNNMTKYGFKFSLAYFLQPPSAAIPAGDAAFEVPALLLHGLKALATWMVSISMNYALERYAATHDVRERVMLALNAVISAFNLIVPCYWVWTSKIHPGMNMIFLFFTLILWMKLISYAHANKDLRVAARKARRIERDASGGYSSNDDLVSADNTNASNSKLARALVEVKDVEPPFLFYPDNVTVSNLSYFLAAPTLCYQLNYPRIDSIRWKKVGFLLFRMAFVAVALLFSVEQYIKPTLEGVVAPMQSGDVLLILERLLKLSIPTTYVWLLVFYFFFHLYLNLLAELTRFGDRLFYKDWWNAKTIDRYWRTWNMPVHHWAARHIYHPLLRAKFSKNFATLVVFLFSALLHEVAISLPFRHVSYHAFVGMLAQAPLIAITKYLDRRYDNAFLGNTLFWCTFCMLGQPMGVILYYYDLSKLSMSAAAAGAAAGVLGSCVDAAGAVCQAL